MKRYIYVLVALLFIIFDINAQDLINFPVEGSVFQQNSAGVAVFRFGGQVKSNKTFYFSIKKRIGDNTFTTINADQRTISLGSTTPDGSKLYFINQSSNQNIELSKGYYKLTLYYKTPSGWFKRTRTECDTVNFAVGDVYYIGGQSNAAGYGGRDMTGFGGNNYAQVSGFDDALSTTGATEYSPMIRVYSNREHENNASGDFTSPQKEVILGIPYKSYSFLKDPNNSQIGSISVNEGFNIFKNGKTENTDANRVAIYPNGYNSWCWAPLGYKLATIGGTKYTGTPTLWFNAAASGTSMVDARFPNNMSFNYNAWGRDYYISNSLANKLGNTIRNYSGAFGAKSVLWCQGENDTFGISSSDKLVNGIYKGDDYILSNYQTVLEKIIEISREAATGATAENPSNGFISFNDLNWFVAKTTANPTWEMGSNQYQYLEQISINGTNAVTSGEIRSRQLNNQSNRIFEGPDTDLLVDGKRSTGQNVHFTGAALNDLANAWYSKINTASGQSSVPPAQLLSLSSVTGGGSTYTLTVDNSIDASHFFWQKNNEALMRYPNNPNTPNVLSNETSGPNRNVRVFNNVVPGDVLHCYALKNGRFHPVVPYVVPNPTLQEKILDTQNASINLNSSGTAVSTGLIAQNVNWDIDQNSLGWVEYNYDEDNNRLIFSASATTSSRIKEIILKDTESSLTKTVTINQVVSGNSSTPLTSITPNANSSLYRLGQSISGSDGPMKVSGIGYPNGFGTHGPSSLFFNLNGQYSTLSGKVGRDDSGDNIYNSGNVQFKIKGDGAILWTSTIHGTLTNVENFNISIAGINVIELYVDNSTDNDYFDHGDWIDMYLNGESCNNPTPTNVISNNYTLPYGGGTVTLSANCSSGSVSWNTGQTGSPIDVNLNYSTSYNATCVGGSCNPSNPVSITITVEPNGPCDLVHDHAELSTWRVTGHPLVARYFHNAYWLTQRIGTNPETFLVRGSEMLNRSDVNPSYSLINPELKNCFPFIYSAYGGLAGPNATEFPTPDGFAMGYECTTPPCNASNGTRYFYATSAPPSCSNLNLINSWTYASSAGSTTGPPRIGKSIENNDMTMGSVNYTTSYPGTGIGTHAFSEIIYDFGASHSFQYFKATVGKDNESVCGENRLVFKVLNNTTGAILAQSPVVGNPAYGLPQTYDMSVNIAGVQSLKLVVEDGGDNIYCDHANWARARLTCDANARKSADGDSTQYETDLKISPNPSEGELTIEFGLENEGPVSIQLLNAAGFAFKTESISGVKGRNSIKFDTGKNIVPGQYIISVVSPGQRLTGHVSIVK